MQCLQGACSVTEGAPDAEAREQADTAGSQHRLGSVQHEASSSSQTEVVEPSAGTVPQSRKADCSQGSQPGQVSITASSQIGRWVRGLTPTPLVTNHQTAGQVNIRALPCIRHCAYFTAKCRAFRTNANKPRWQKLDLLRDRMCVPCRCSFSYMCVHSFCLTCQKGLQYVGHVPSTQNGL